MNRKQFLKNCAGGLCSCAAFGALAPTLSAAAEDKKPEDWRLPFVKRRYAKLLEIITARVDDATSDEILRQLGAHCATTYPLTQKHKGDVDGFIRESKKQSKDEITYDREKGVITIIGEERGDCFCPLVAKNLTPGKACNCSLGWNQKTYETVLGRKVEVTLTETVLRGGKRCSAQIRVLEQQA